jgi:hypothetical protein
LGTVLFYTYPYPLLGGALMEFLENFEPLNFFWNGPGKFFYPSPAPGKLLEFYEIFCTLRYNLTQGCFSFVIENKRKKSHYTIITF